MNCRYQKYISRWMDQKLDGVQRTDFEAHFKTCAICQKELIAERKLNTLIKSSLPVVEPSANFERLFWQKVLEREKEPWWAKVSRAMDALIPANLAQAFAVLIISFMIGGAGGIFSAKSALTSQDIMFNQASIQYLSGFQEFKGIPETSVSAVYLKTNGKGKLS